MTSSNAMRLNVAYKACEMEEKIYTKFKKYIGINFKGQNNMAIFEFAENVNKSFEKFRNENFHKDIFYNCVDMIFKAYIIFSGSLHTIPNPTKIVCATSRLHSL